MAVLNGTELAFNPARVNACRLSLTRVAFAPRNTTTWNPLAQIHSLRALFYTYHRTYLPTNPKAIILS